MKLKTRSAAAKQQLPTTYCVQQLNDELTIFLRPWGAAEYNQKVVDEITHYLSTTQADIEVTTPFDYLESLSSLANRTRVSLLLAHDLLYKTDNRTEYVVGFEVMVLFRSKNELAWASIGRYSMATLQDNRLNQIIAIGSDLDSEVLLPVQLIGLEKQISVNAGSIAFGENSKVIVGSTFDSDMVLSDANSESNFVEINPSNSTYWFSLVTAG